MRAVQPVWKESQTLDYENNHPCLFKMCYHCTVHVMWCCYDTWIHPQVVHTSASMVKWTHARFSMQNNLTRMEKHKKLSWWYCHMVVSFDWLQKQLQFLTLNGGEPTVKWWLLLPHFEYPQWPLSLVVPPPHAHDPPDMHTSLVSSRSVVEWQ